MNGGENDRTVVEATLDRMVEWAVEQPSGCGRSSLSRESVLEGGRQASSVGAALASFLVYWSS